MSDELPMCACDEFYAGHHPECPVRREIETLQGRIAELESTFKHTHSSIGMDNDACATCGLDLRDPIHKRAGE